MPRSSNATPWRVAQANTSTSPNGTLTPARNQARAIFAASTQQTGRVPGIFNTDQGGQFTSAEWIGRLEGLGVKVSMDGRGRWMDNVFIERLWRSVKYECVYLHGHGTLTGRAGNWPGGSGL